MIENNNFWTKHELSIIIILCSAVLALLFWLTQGPLRESSIERGDAEFRQSLDRRWNLAYKCDSEMREYGQWFEAQCPQLFSDGYLSVRPTALAHEKRE